MVGSEVVMNNYSLTTYSYVAYYLLWTGSLYRLVLFRSSNGYGLLVVHIGETVYIYIVYYLPTTHRLVVYTDLCYSGVVVVYMGETVYVYISEYMAGSYCYLCEGLLQKTFSMVCWYMMKNDNCALETSIAAGYASFFRKSFTWKRWKRNRKRNRKRWKRWGHKNCYIWCWKRVKSCNYGHGCTIKKHREYHLLHK